MASTSASSSSSSSSKPPRKPSAFTSGYVDIFDAPERPSEPSTHVRFAAAAPTRASYSEPGPRPRASGVGVGAGAGAGVKPLPAPVMYDGPARPGGGAAVPYRAQRAYPARVWPPRAAGGKNARSMAISMAPLVISGVGVGVLLGID
ncbi:hypothetical protein C8Q77DRAFT_1217440 [Trametes polyzona]|nr:hypothetical protein C8Q77DRAFT_1217440 [Trametes polyzona]